MSTLCLIFRRKQAIFFSIERIFQQLEKEFEKAFQVSKVEVPRNRLKLGNVFINLFSVRKIHADIFHITGDIHYVGLALPKRKTILTIHDSVFMFKTSGWKKKILYHLMLKWPVRHAQIITTISHQSKIDIIKFTGCPEKKIVVIPNPVNSTIIFKEKPFNAQEPNILFIGTTPNKNLLRVIEALKGLRCVLDVVGIVSSEDIRQIEQNSIIFRQSHGLSDTELAEKYVNCDIVLFPSTYEGFGLPIVEAQKAGRAVITSDLNPMKETAGEGACLVDPYDVQSIRKAILSLISNKSYRDSIIDKGFENCSKYSVEAIADRYKELYHKIAQA